MLTLTGTKSYEAQHFTQDRMHLIPEFRSKSRLRRALQLVRSLPFQPEGPQFGPQFDTWLCQDLN